MTDDKLGGAWLLPAHWGHGVELFTTVFLIAFGNPEQINQGVTVTRYGAVPVG
jgi:hypothetical protein